VAAPRAAAPGDSEEDEDAPDPDPVLDAAAAASPVKASLYKEYAHLFDTCLIRPSHLQAVARQTKRVVDNRAIYEQTSGQSNVPWWFIGAIHSLESSLNFERHPHNGDPLTARTVRVPKGRPDAGDPPFTFAQSAADWLTLKKLDRWPDWSIPAALYKMELNNGLGYRKHHPDVLSPYLWSFTNHYTKGKYVADGRFDPNAVSKQVGGAAILRLLVSEGLVDD
jgi:lysozyme family protein